MLARIWRNWISHTQRHAHSHFLTPHYMLTDMFYYINIFTKIQLPYYIHTNTACVSQGKLPMLSALGRTILVAHFLKKVIRSGKCYKSTLYSQWKIISSYICCSSGGGVQKRTYKIAWQTWFNKALSIQGTNWVTRQIGTGSNFRGHWMQRFLTVCRVNLLSCPLSCYTELRWYHLMSQISS